MQRLVDVVILLPGIMGSVLRRNGTDVWAPTVNGLLNAALSEGEDIQALKLTDDPSDQLELDDGVTVGGIMPSAHIFPGLWKIDGYSETREALRGFLSGVKPGRNYFEFAYDWRRDNRVAAKKLKLAADACLQQWRTASDGNPKAKLILIGHSMGGLVARYFLEVLEGWRDTRALITFGTPYSGSLNALNFLANGYRKAWGIVDLSEMVRSFTSIYQLLPTYKCCDFGDKQLSRVDDPRGIPNLCSDRVAAALAFHREIADQVAAHSELEEYRADGYKIYPVVGTHQPTLQSARIARGADLQIELLADYLGEDYSGDGTVPRVSATPPEWTDPAQGMFSADKHASLQNAQPVLDHLEGVLSGMYMEHAVQRLAPTRGIHEHLVHIGVALDDAFDQEESIFVRAYPDAENVALRAVIQDAQTGAVVAEQPMKQAAGMQTVEFAPLPKGTYRISVTGDQTVLPVADLFEVFAAAREPRRMREVASVGTLGSRLIEPRQLEWTNDVIIASGTDTPAQLKEKLVDHVPQFVVINRRNDFVYAFKPCELDPLLTAPLLEGPLHEFQSSKSTFSKMASVQLDLDNPFPAARRVILRSDRGRPIGVGVPPEASRSEKANGGARRGVIVEGPPAAGPMPIKCSTVLPLDKFEGTSVTRYPSIQIAGDIEPEQVVSLSVDLARLRDEVTESTGVLFTAPEGWKQLKVGVHIVAPDLEFAEGEDDGEILVLNGADSIPLRRSVRVANDLGGREHIEVRAFFVYGGRASGSARRRFQVVQPAMAATSVASGSKVGVPGIVVSPAMKATATATTTAVPAQSAIAAALHQWKLGDVIVPESTRKAAPLDDTRGNCQIAPAATPPKMTIEMFHSEGMPAGMLLWHIDCPDQVRAECTLPSKLSGTVNLGVDAPEYVAELFAGCERKAPPDHMLFFQGLGEKLYEKTPACFRETYWSMIDRYGSGFPIQIMSDDPYIPWELMRPYRDGGESPEFLGIAHPVARWFIDQEGKGGRQSFLPAGTVATIVPDYASRPDLKPLIAAKREREAIENMLTTRALVIEGLKAEVISVLEDNSNSSICLLHFAGHGVCDSSKTDFARICLEDRDLEVYEVRRSETKLGRHRHALVLLNACQVGRSGLNMGVIGGFAEALMQCDFGGLVAPLWAVYDDSAATASKQFIKETVLENKPFAEVLRDIRKTYGPDCPTFLSYLYYGDVMAKFA